MMLAPSSSVVAAIVGLLVVMPTDLHLPIDHGTRHSHGAPFKDLLLGRNHAGSCPFSGA